MYFKSDAMSKHLQYTSEYLDTRPRLNDSLYFLNENYLERKFEDRKIVEVGTRRWFDKSTHHKKFLSLWKSYLMIDVTPGDDVDLVADLHDLHMIENDSVDVVWASSVFEHLHSPWIAAKEILRVLKPGGLFFIQTHLCFPEHGYPNDYFRFTRMALDHLFKDASEKVSCYEYEATLTPHHPEIKAVWNTDAPAPLNVCIAGRK